MKILLVYATKTGCTQGIAERIGVDLESHGANVEVMAAQEASDPAGFDAVVVGSGVRAGTWHRAAKSWVESNAEALRQMPVAFFTCGLTMTDESKADEVRAYTNPIIAATGVKPVDIGLFAGWNDLERLGFAERTIMKLMKAPEGDFRDWDAIDAWTDEVGPVIGIPS